MAHSGHPASTTRVAPLAATVALLLLAAIFALVPEGLSVGPRWLIPVLILAGGLGARGARYRLSPRRTHALFLAVNGGICVIVAISAFALIAVGLFGGTLTSRALLADAALVWGLNVLAFALLYWTIDGGGPAKRRMENHVSDDFIFPQMTMEDPRCNAWHPQFLDSLQRT